MAGRILVVDDLFCQAKSLEERLLAGYYSVTITSDCGDALSLCEQGMVDLVLLDAEMPDPDGFEICRRIKASPRASELPVILVTRDTPLQRFLALEAGADDCLSWPGSNEALMARVRSQMALWSMRNELRDSLALSEAIERDLCPDEPVSVLVVDEDQRSRERIKDVLCSVGYQVELEPDPEQALVKATSVHFDVTIVSLTLSDGGGSRLCSQLRQLERTKHMPVVALTDAITVELRRALEITSEDFLCRPVDRSELLARIRTAWRKRHSAEALHAFQVRRWAGAAGRLRLVRRTTEHSHTRRYAA